MTAFGQERSLDHPVGTQQQGLRNRNTERLCRLEIDDKLESGWLLDCKLSWIRALQYFVDVASCRALLFVKAKSIGKEPALVAYFRNRKRNGQIIGLRELEKFCSLKIDIRAENDKEGSRLLR